MKKKKLKIEADAELIKKLRSEKGLSVRSAAIEADVSRTQWMQVESGIVKKPRVDTLYRIASVLGVSIIGLILVKD